MSAELSPAHERYLRLLGVTAAPPSLELLSRLVRAQIICCPFENISKLYAVRRLGRPRLPTLAEHLDGIELHHLGGTCYANNHHFHGLLRALGFDCSFCGADMNAPDLHTVIVVRLDGGEYLVDAGYAAPFFEPLALDAPAPRHIAWGNEAFRLWPRDPDGRSRVDHLRDGQRVHGYSVNPAPRELSHFERVIRESLSDSAPFMNAVRFERFSPRGSVSLYNHALRVVEGGRVSFSDLPDRDAIIDALDAQLGVAREVSAAALESIGALEGIH